MASLCIVEDPSYGGLYTRAIAPHTGSVFEQVGYVANKPLEGVQHERLDPGKPVQGYTHFLLVGSPEFLSRQTIPAGRHYGAYVLAESQFIPLEHVGWITGIPRIAVPSAMVGGALTLAHGKPVTYREVRPWGFATPPRCAINRTEIRQLLVPSWDHTAPVVLAQAEFADVMCAMLSRTQNVNLLLLGEEDSRHPVRMDMCGVNAGRVRFSTSTLAWDAADVFAALTPFTAWPWDVVYAISRRLPTVALKSHVYETFIDSLGCVGPITALDPITAQNRLGYQANSADIAQALGAFMADPTNLHARVHTAAKLFAEHTQERFATALIQALFTEQA